MRTFIKGRLFVEALEGRTNPGVIDVASPIAEIAGPGLGGVQVVNAGSNAGAVNDDNTVGWPKTHFVSHDVSFAKSDYIDRAYTVNDSEGVTEFNFESLERPVVIDTVHEEPLPRHTTAGFQESRLVFWSPKRAENPFVTVVDPYDFV